MWCEAGLPAEAFWGQTQRSFHSALSGAARHNTKQAYMIAGLSAAAQCGKLRELDDYLPSDPNDAASSAQLLHGFRRLQARGVNMTIERLH